MGGGVSVRLSVAETTLRYALTYVLEGAGYRVRATAAVFVADRLSAAEPIVHTLIVDPVPAACQRAVAAITDGRARSAICSDEPEQLPVVLAGAVHGLVSFPERLLHEAHRAPRLEPRLAATLHLLLAGHSNLSIGRQLHASESTVKRDVAALLRIFDVPNRNLLAAVARQSGFDHRARAPM